MKKRNLFTLGLMGMSLLFMTSCNDDDDDPAPVGPTMSMEEITTGTTSGDITITQGEGLIFAWDARRGDNDLETFRVVTSGSNVVNPLPISYEGNEFPYEIANADDEIYIDTVAFPDAGVNLGLTTYTFTVEDEAGVSRSIKFDVTVEESVTTTPLSDAESFTWVRQGGNPATGLDQFGLKWTSNTATSAIVTISEATKMVSLSNNDWVNIDTKEALAAAIDAASAIAQYDNVSVEQNDTYSDVLGVHHNDTYYILRILSGEVTSSGTGTTVTIEGEYKN